MTTKRVTPARATVEHTKELVTDAISRITETVRPLAAATSEQARGSELGQRGIDAPAAEPPARRAVPDAGWDARKARDHLRP